MLFDTVSAPKKGGKRDENVENVGKSYTVEEILHPTLHRKLPDFIGIFHIGCRKCRIFLQTFFVGCRNVLYMKAPEEEKHRTSLHKTSVLLRQNLRTFAQRSPMFLISETLSCGGLPKRIAKKEIPRPPGNPVNGGFCPIIL